MTERYCAECGNWRSMYSTLRDPRRSLCQTCYMNIAVRTKFGKGYMGPHATKPHSNVEMWFKTPWGQDWLKRGSRVVLAEQKGRAHKELQERRMIKERELLAGWRPPE